MKKLLKAAILLVVISMLPVVQGKSAAAGAPSIVDINFGTLLMDDGSLWVRGASKASSLDVASMYDNGFFGYGVTAKGELVTWSDGKEPKVYPEQNGIRQIAEGFYVKNDGTVHGIDGTQVPDIDSNVLMLVHRINSFAYLTQSGDLVYKTITSSFKLDQLQDPASIVSLAASGSGEVATLDKTGKVMLYRVNGELQEPSGILTNNAACITFDDSEDEQLQVTLKDGTVWTTGKGTNEERFKLAAPFPGVENAVKTTSFTDGNSFYFEQKDGSWKQYDNGTVTPIELPSATNLTFTLSNVIPQVGSSISGTIVEDNSNGTTRTVPLSEAKVMIQKPSLLKLMPDGTFKALAVGQTKVAVTSDDITVELTVSISLGQHLTGAKQMKGVTYLPVQSVFKALGGTVAYTAQNKTFNIKLDNTALSLTVGTANAKAGGKTVNMGAAVISENGSTLFPAKLLSQALGATLKWDARYQQMGVSFGSATMTVESAETAKVKKKEALGNLVNLIGRSFWVNHYDSLPRFSKVSVADINPESGNGYAVVLKLANGGNMTTHISQNDIVSVFSDGDSFLTYNPYTKYHWSTSVWNSVKEGNVTKGMNKDQVLLSWGDPLTTSEVSGGGITVESWGYSGLKIVVFTNGKVSDIYTSY